MRRFDDAAYYNWLMAASHKNRAAEISDGKHPHDASNGIVLYLVAVGVLFLDHCLAGQYKWCCDVVLQ